MVESIEANHQTNGHDDNMFNTKGLIMDEERKEKAVRHLFFWQTKPYERGSSFSAMLYNLMSKADGDNQQR